MGSANNNTNPADSWSWASAQFSAQWAEPSDIFSILLILGGDVIQLAITALAGGQPLTPVTFSFGCVAYAVSAVVSAVGDNNLITCAPEVPLKVFNLCSGYRRDNRSWVLGRLLKTYPFWMPDEVRQRLRYDPRVDEELANGGRPGPISTAARHVPLCAAIYRWREDLTPCRPTRDLVWWSGFLATFIQLGIAAIPLGLYHDWSIFLATAGGTILSYASGSLPQWRHEKWHARRGPKDGAMAITFGNGSQHVIIVLGSERGLNLEDMATSRAPDLWSTKISTSALAVLWLVLLIACTGIKTHTWYLLAVGALGMLHNVIVAGAPRRPEALGMPIEIIKPVTDDVDNSNEARTAGAIFAEPKVMWTLMELEEKYEAYGKVLLGEFFPGKLRAWEEKWWASTDVNERRRLLRQAQEDEREKALKKEQQQNS